MSRMIVVQYEQFFRASEANDLPEALRTGLETLREYAGARVIGSYEVEESKEWYAKSVTSIVVNGPIIVEVD